MTDYIFNPYYKKNPDLTGEEYKYLSRDDARAFHRILDGYEPTPLTELPGLASKLNIHRLFVKDESRRFGIKAFKALGASYAIYRVVKEKWEAENPDEEFSPMKFRNPLLMNDMEKMTFCSATDGNHGRAVAWTARHLKQKAVIYMPDNSVPARIENIKNEGAEVVLVAGTFDDCVARCSREAEKNGWQVIADTAYPGFMDIPKNIILGYMTIFREIEEQRVDDFDFVFMPAGVGGLAASGTALYTMKYGENRPQLICVEPEQSDCFLESIKNGKGEPLPTKGKQGSIMAGLNCGMPSLVAWPIVRDGMNLFMSVSDDFAEKAMREYAQSGVTSGESGAAALAGLIALMTEESLQDVKNKLGINERSKILVINTEGDTDPVNYRKVIGG